MGSSKLFYYPCRKRGAGLCLVYTRKEIVHPIRDQIASTDIVSPRCTQIKEDLRTRSGAFEFLRSQSNMTGLVSSGIAVISFVCCGLLLAMAIAIDRAQQTCSGCQATALTALRPRLFNVSDSFLDFTSHTVTKPPFPPVTKMWGTFLFQSRQSKSSARAALFPRRKGFSVLLRSQTYSYRDKLAMLGFYL